MGLFEFDFSIFILATKLTVRNGKILKFAKLPHPAAPAAAAAAARVCSIVGESFFSNEFAINFVFFL